MSWSLDWFAAAEQARAGAYIRRAGWTDRWLLRHRGLWWIATAAATRVVRTTDYTRDDLSAWDWTTEPFTSDVCGATPAYNTAGQQHRGWTSAPVFRPPPVPGFAEEDA